MAPYMTPCRRTLLLGLYDCIPRIHAGPEHSCGLKAIQPAANDAAEAAQRVVLRSQAARRPTESFPMLSLPVDYEINVELLFTNLSHYPKGLTASRSNVKLSGTRAPSFERNMGSTWAWLAPFAPKAKRGCRTRIREKSTFSKIYCLMWSCRGLSKLSKAHVAGSRSTREPTMLPRRQCGDTHRAIALAAGATLGARRA